MGRADDVIVSAGYRIGPFEVESALVSHPAVAEAAASRRRIRSAARSSGPWSCCATAIRRPELAGELQDHVKRETAPVQVPADRRVRRVAAEDPEREDQAGRAARVGLSRAPSGIAERLWTRFTPAHGAFAGIFVVTLLGLLSVGATLPVLPHYVKGPLGAGDVSVGVVTGAFAITGLAFRPIGGHLADSRGRRLVVVVGALSTATAGLLYFIPAGVPGLIVARLFLGAGEGMVYTAGAAWVVDLAPAARRGRIIGLYGLAVWGGLSLGPPIGELILHVWSYGMVWAFAAAAPLIGALIATRIPQSYRPQRRAREGGWIAREAVGPGAAFALSIIGYAALAAFIVLHLEEIGADHGALVFTAFALTVVAMRALGGGLPDRFGGARCAAWAGVVDAIGLALIAAAHSLPVALAGAMAMGAGYALMFPSLALLFLNRTPERRRGIAMGTFTAFFDVGVGVGAPLAGVAAAIGGYPAAFALASVCALGTTAYALVYGARARALHTEPDLGAAA